MADKRKSTGGSSTATLSEPTRSTSKASEQALRPAAPAAVAQRPAAELARSTSTKPLVQHEDIARAAYLRWQREGGDPTTNWLAAEAELTGRAALKL